MFEPISSKMNINEYEEEVLGFWDKEKVFKKSLDKNKGKETFVFYEGPPTANAKPHVGGALTRVYKDVFPRYKTMRGYYTPRRAGWDTHGLPVELEVEKELGFKTKQDIENYGVAKFNEKCKENVWKYKTEWEKVTRRIGFWLDFDDAYITYDPKYIESLWWIIKQFYGKGLLYQDYKVVPYCPRCGTSLSSHELAQGYETVKDRSVYAKFKIKSDDPRWEDAYILSWTTTPWTLPGNVALAVNPAHTFVKVGDLILEKSSYDRLVGSKIIEDTGKVEEFPSSDLIGLAYEPLFDIENLKNENSHKVYEADFVTTDEGTGVVHTAVMYGEDDYELGKKVGLPQHHTVDEFGKFTAEVKGFEGLFVKAAKTEERIIDYLSNNGNLLTEQLYEHEYPFCWRCKTPLLYYALTSWFVAVSKLRDKLKENNQTVNWVPAHLKDGRFGNFLDEAKDWNFSRSRYWGTPLPIWICGNCGEKKCIGSFEELGVEKDFDPHRPYVDDVLLKCDNCKGEMQRVPFLVDVWFDSGSMPYAQLHYPFENEKEFDNNFPADFIAEAVDQTRGWFYTLLAVSTLLDRGAPYKNVISFNHVLDDKGQKMSKSKGNVVAPEDVMSNHGADPLRWYMLSTNFSSGPRQFSDGMVGEVVKGFFNTLWNSHSFFFSYASVDKWTKDNLNNKFIQHKDRPTLDRWILSKLASLTEDVTGSLENYDATLAVSHLETYLDDLSNWYIRRSRRRFWKSENSDDKESAYQTLYETLLTFDKLLAPIIPFTAEFFYRKLTGGDSVHLSDWPAQIIPSDDLLESTMTQIREAIAVGLGLRAEAGIKVRQPLAKVELSIKTGELADELKELVKDELNVHEVAIQKAGELRVVIDTKITEELMSEGVMREIVRLIQSLRKDAGYELTDRIKVFMVHSDTSTKKAVGLFADVITKEVLANRLESAPALPEGLDVSKEAAINGAKLLIGISK